MKLPPRSWRHCLKGFAVADHHRRRETGARRRFQRYNVLEDDCRPEQRGGQRNVNSTPTNTARTELHSMITFHHANTRGSRAAKLRIAHLCVLKNNCHPRVMSRPLPHLTLTTSTSSLSPIPSTSSIFPMVSPLQTSPMILDPHIPCDVPRQSGGSAQIPSLTGYEPKSSGKISS